LDVNTVLQGKTQIEDIRMFEKRLLRRSAELNREIVTGGWEAF
jgi:hypothetical protein